MLLTIKILQDHKELFIHIIIITTLHHWLRLILNTLILIQKQLIYKIKDGELGVVNINNMIPTPIEELKEVLPTITDKKYKKMLEE